MSRQDQWLISVYVESAIGSGKLVKIPDPFDKCSGGDVTASETKYREGGMRSERAYGGPVSVGNVTVGRRYDYERDHDYARKLASLCGRARMSITKQPLGVSGDAVGKPHVYSGILMTVNYPDADSSSTSINMLELVCSTDGVLG
ncbi:hypothetical protein [Kineosporia succinea]|uniref:Uncharacterized protein n=1 Tax=Kineosporia succinea TaxID=84632 RepID=A0ABT9P9S4_9ACTN|nr:hypothetical protein [Kineosporia succinea]MDP9829451.1 hypothetical protein [Kineosporia succinea]